MIKHTEPSGEKAVAFFKTKHSSTWRSLKETVLNTMRCRKYSQTQVQTHLKDALFAAVFSQQFYLSVTIYTWFDHKVLVTSIVYPVKHHNYSTKLSSSCLWGGAGGFSPVRSYRVPVMVWILFSIIQRKKVGWEDEISLSTLSVTKTLLGCCITFKMLHPLISSRNHPLSKDHLA